MAVWLAYGMPGAGKSTLLHDLVSAHAHAHRLFVQDNEAGWGPEAVHWRGKPPKGLRVIQGEEAFADFAGEALENELPNGAYVFRSIDAHSIVDLAIAVGYTTYVNDEIDLIATRKGWDDSPLRAIVHMGRHVENAEGEHTQVHLIGACRRPQSLHTDLTELADQVYAFRVRGKNTLKRLLDDEVIATDEDAERLRTLPNFECVHYPSGQWLKLQPVGVSKGAAPTGQAPLPAASE